MYVIGQIVGALVEAWGEVKVQKARVILSLVGVVAAVAAMSTVIALGEVMQQSLSEMQEAFQGRNVTLNIGVRKKAEDSEAAPGSEAGVGQGAGFGPLPVNDPPHQGGEQESAQEGPKEDAKGKPVDPEGDAMATVADRFKIPYWSRLIEGQNIEVREYLEADNTGEFRGQPIIRSWMGYIPPSLKAVDPSYQTIYRLTMTQGRWLHDDDWQQRVAPVVINTPMWDGLGRPNIEDPIVLTVNDESGRSFRVVGVTKAKSNYESPTMYINYTGWKYMSAAQTENSDSQLQPTRMLVWTGPDQMKQARRVLPAALAAVMGPQYEGDALGGGGQDWGQGSLQTVNNVIMVIGGIVIFLGALGLLNVAVVTVRQRIREIGIRRAMGASATRVFFAVFMESVVATFVAGVLGVAIAIIVFRILPLEAMDIFLQDKPAFPMNAALAGVGISTFIGALCGLIPAFSAVRVKPIDAIRY